MHNKNFYARNVAQMQIVAVITLGSIVWLLSIPALAAAPGGDEIDWFKLGMGLFGGLAVFLIGIEQLSGSLQAAAGEKLKVLLAKLTKNKLMGLFTGAGVTALLNSSTVTTVLIVGFVTAGVMTLTQSIAVIFGANVGSTITAQIVAFNITQYALAMIAIGFIMRFAAKTDRGKHYGSMLTGLGLLFFGMGIIGDAMSPLRSYQPFLDLMVRMENPALGVLVGLLFTALVNSSAATLGIAIVMATEGLITLEAGIALALGANIGTIFTTLIAAIGKPRDAIRAAWVHGLFNIIGPVLWIPLIPQLVDIATWISPSSPELQGTARMAAEVPRQIANAHTVLNVVNALVFLNFTGLFIRAVMWMFPDKPAEEKKVIIEPEYLSEELIETPTLALERVRMEIARMGEITQAMLVEIHDAFEKEDRTAFENVEKMDDQIDLLHDYIIHYLGEVREQDLTEEQEEEFIRLLGITDDLESYADVIETDLVLLGHQLLESTEIKFSGTIETLMTQLYDVVVKALHAVVEAVKENDQRKAQDVRAMKEEVKQTVQMALKHQSARLTTAEPGRLAGFRLEMEILDKLERLYKLTRRIAKKILPTELFLEQA